MTRWLVDAMNVIGSRPDKWWNDRKKAMRAFAAALNDFALATSDDVTVVFDTDPGPLEDSDNITVVVARRAGRNAADYEIERIVKVDDAPETLRVVTSDKRLVERVSDLGAKTVSSGSFRNRVDKLSTRRPS